MQEKKDDPIGNALGLNPLVTSDSVKNIIANAYNDSAKNDFEMARSNIHEVIQNGAQAIEKLSQIADSSQHPRAFEVLAKLMDSVVSANKELLALQKEIRDIDWFNCNSVFFNRKFDTAFEVIVIGTVVKFLD